MAREDGLDPSFASEFPLEDIPAVVKLFEKELIKPDPNLTLLSIIAGAVENSMTCTKNGAALGAPDVVSQEKYEVGKIPTIHFHQVNALYMKFYSLIKGSVDLTIYDKTASRELIRRVSDVVWNSLSRSQYKDSRAHLQSLYSYMTGN